jgi:hypothetical protein
VGQVGRGDAGGGDTLTKEEIRGETSGEIRRREKILEIAMCRKTKQKKHTCPF